jgi:hypothetical protein
VKPAKSPQSIARTRTDYDPTVLEFCASNLRQEVALGEAHYGGLPNLFHFCNPEFTVRSKQASSAKCALLDLVGAGPISGRKLNDDSLGGLHRNGNQTSFNVLDVGKLRSETSVMKEKGFYWNVSDVHVPAYHGYKADCVKLNRHLSRKNLSII